MSDGTPRRRSRKLRKIAGVLAIFVVALLLVLVLAGPTILAAAAPMVARNLGIPGRLVLEDVALSWTGQLAIDGAALYNAENEQIAGLSVRTGGGLLGLLDAYVEQDIVVDGWAAVRMDEQGVTNIERALGIERGQDDTPAEDSAGPPRLPFDRVILDGLDVAFTQAAKPTLAIAGLKGEILADGSRIKTTLGASLAMPAEHPDTRSRIESAATHGNFELSADIGLEDMTGTALARVTEISPQFAQALGAQSGDEAVERAAHVAARGGLNLELNADIAAGTPRDAKVSADSQTIQASLAVRSEDGAFRLDSPASVEIDTAAFLAEDAIRRVALPAEGVELTQAGRISLNVERLVLPLAGNTPQLDQTRAIVRGTIGPTSLNIPGADGSTAEVRLSDISMHLGIDAANPIELNATAKAAVNDQPEGVLSLDGRADAAAMMEVFTGEDGIQVAGLARAVPAVQLKLQQVPLLAAKPWLSALEQAGLSIEDVTGPTLDATLAWTGNDDGSASVSLGVDAPHVKADAHARWTADAVALVSPASFSIARPAALASPWLPEGWSMRNGRGVEISVAELRLPMNGMTPDLAGTQTRATVRAGGLEVSRPDAPTIGLETLELNIDADAGQSTVQLSSTPTIAGQAASLTADLRSAGLATLMDAQAMGTPRVLGEVRFEGPTQLAQALDIQAAGRPLHAWLADAVGPDFTLVLELAEPPEGALAAGQLSIDAQHATLRASGLRASAAEVSLDGLTLRATPSALLWEGLAPKIGMEGSTLASTTSIVVNVGAGRFAFEQGANPLAGLDQTSVQLATESAIRINNLPTGQADESGDRPRTDVSIAVLQAGLNSVGRAIAGRSDLEASLDLTLDSPGLGRVAAVDARVTSDARGDLTAQATIAELSIRDALMLAGIDGAGADAAIGSLGDTGRIVVRANASATPEAAIPWEPTQVSLDLGTPRLTSSRPIVANFSDDTIQLAETTTITWTPDAQWLESAIGARITSVQPLQIRLDRIDLGNPLEQGVSLLDPTLVFVDASLDAQGATIAMPEKPSIELQAVTGRLRRIARSSYAITGQASTAGGGTLELNGLIQKPTDAQGRLDLQTAEVRGTIKGDGVPVALADALSNTDGLLADCLGPVVDLDAEIQHGRLIPGKPPQADLRFSVRGERADASGYGRLANHTISMPQPQTVLTVREVRPEIAERFSEIIPELLQVEKRPGDGPAIIRTEGLVIPTNGEWARGQGDITIALGTARFRTTSVLSSVLKATGQRERGSLGRRIDPIHLKMVDGVIIYEPFTLPLGDLEIESEGTVNLAENTMDVIVWIPIAALSDEAAGRFNTGLGSALGRSVPGFGSVSTVPWRVSGDLASPSILPAPQVLIRRRGSEFLGPLMRPGESLQDLLSIPRRREQPSEGG